MHPTTFTIKNVLVATDLSARSDRAITRAVEIARRLDAQLYVVHIADADTITRSLRARYEQEALEIVRRQIGNQRGRVGRTEVILKFGDVYPTAVKLISQLNIDLLVLGTHRKRPILDAFIGTTGERIIRYARVPALVVRDVVHGPYRNLLFALDFSPCSRKAITVAGALVDRATARLVHAYILPFSGLIGSSSLREAKTELHARGVAALLAEQASAAKTGVKLKFLPPIVSQGAVSEVVGREFRRQSADLMVFGTHGRSGLGTTMIGSVAAGFLNDPLCDVLVVPE
ncbi:MAG: universal stress protein [Alphaproteobacteria bacterium]